MQCEKTAQLNWVTVSITHSTAERKKGGMDDLRVSTWDSQDMVEKQGLLISVSFMCFFYMFWLRFPKLCKDVGPLSMLKLRNLTTKSPRQMWKLQPKCIICNSTCFTAFSNKCMKTQNETSCANFFLPAGQIKAAVCPTIAVGSHVFSSLDAGIRIMTKKANACSEQPTCLTDLTMACFLSKYTLWECYYACHEANELHFLSSTATGLTRTAGQRNQQVQSTTDGCKTNFFSNSPLLVTVRKIQHHRYLFLVQYKRKHIWHIAKKICCAWQHHL